MGTTNYTGNIEATGNLTAVDVVASGDVTVTGAVSAASLTVNSLTIPTWNLVSLDAATFIGATTDARGEYDGSGNPTTLFTVTGDVLVIVFAKCTTLLAGTSATIEVGVSGDTASIIAQSTATDIDANEIWNGATPAAVALLTPKLVSGGADIIETIATADITSGVLEYHCLWLPISSGASVVAA